MYQCTESSVILNIKSALAYLMTHLLSDGKSLPKPILTYSQFEISQHINQTEIEIQAVSVMLFRPRCVK